MANWRTVQVVPWNSHELPAHDCLVTIEINFDFAATKSEHSYSDRDGVVRKGTIVHMNNGASYILHNTPDQYPGA